MINTKAKLQEIEVNYRSLKKAKNFGNEKKNSKKNIATLPRISPLPLN